MLYVVGDCSENVAQLEVEILHTLSLAVQSKGELLALNAEVVLVNALDNSADLKDSEISRIAHIGLNLAKLSRDNALSDCLDVGVCSAVELDVRLNLHSECLLLVGVSPNVGVELVEVVSLDEHILNLLLVVLNLVHSDGVEGRTRCVYVKVIVAVNTGDFLDYVRLDCNVLGSSPARNNYREAVAAELDLEAERGESLYNLVV